VLGLEAEDEPVGAEGVLDGERLTQELESSRGVPRTT
jgi:hypothetical protein